MLRYLTDEHIAPAVAEQFLHRQPQPDAVCMRDWYGGHMLGASDELVLQTAHADGLTLVTYDLRTIVPLLRAWAEQGIEHGGVVLVDEKTISQRAVGQLVAALHELWGARRREAWRNRVVFLRRPDVNCR